MADLSDSWKDRPPVQWMVQGYMGIGGRPEEGEDGEFDSLVAGMGRQG